MFKGLASPSGLVFRRVSNSLLCSLFTTRLHLQPRNHFDLYKRIFRQSRHLHRRPRRRHRREILGVLPTPPSCRRANLFFQLSQRPLRDTLSQQPVPAVICRALPHSLGNTPHRCLPPFNLHRARAPGMVTSRAWSLAVEILFSTNRQFSGKPMFTPRLRDFSDTDRRWHRRCDR